MTNKFDNFGEETNLDRPSNKAWGNFAKFEKEGDSQKGILVDVFFKPAEGVYPEQRGFTLEDADGKLVNVAVKNKPAFAVSATNDVRLGDLLTITLDELKPAKEKGWNPTKIYGYASASPSDGSNADQPTVRELIKKEMEAAGIVEESDTEDGESDLPFEG